MSSGKSGQILGFKSFCEFVDWEYASSDTIDLKRIYCDVAGGLNQGLLLSQIVYWRLPSKRGAPTKLSINREGRLWLAKADKAWYGEIRLTKEEAMAARRILEARGLIICRTWKYGGNTCTHISLNEDEFLLQLTTMLSIPEEERDAGPINRAKRVGPKKPGSKPNSGNRRKPDSEEGAETPGSSEVGNMENANSGMSETVIPEPGKDPFQNYGEPHSGISVSAPPFTESPPEIPAEKKIIIVTDSAEVERTDDDLPFETETASVTDEDAWPAMAGDSLSTGMPSHGMPPVTESVQLQATGGEPSQATGTEQVPAAAAAPVETVDNWAVLTLPALDLDVLLARNSRNPVGNTTLRRAMSCSDASRLDHMHDQLAMPLGTTSGNRLVTRDLYTRLTDEEIEAAIVAARVDAQKGVQQFAALGYHALDAMVGFPPSIEVLTKTRKRTSGPSAGAPGTALGAAYEIKGAGARITSAPAPSSESRNEAPSPEYQQGAVWQHKSEKIEVTVVKRDGPDVHVLGSTGIQVIRILDLMRLYRALP